MRPIFGGGIHGLKFLGSLFADSASRLAPHNVNGPMAGELVKPGCQHRVCREPARAAGEFNEDGLGDFLRQFRGANLP